MIFVNLFQAISRSINGWMVQSRNHRPIRSMQCKWMNEKFLSNFFFFLQKIFKRSFRRFSFDPIDVARMIHRSSPSCVFCCCCVLFCYLLPVDTRRVKRTKKKNLRPSNLLLYSFNNIEQRMLGELFIYQTRPSTPLRFRYLPNG